MTEFTKQAMHKAQRIILYGGAFDPVHCAHLAIARRVLAQVAGAELCFIPAARSPLKDSGPFAGDAERLAMLRLAVGELPGCRVDDLELRRGGRSYTVDTVAAFREAHPEAELYWVIGADQFARLHRWREIERLCAMVRFLVVGRPGYDLGEPVVPGLRYELVEMPLMEDSSSEIRRRCQEGKSIEGYLPAEVEAFILEHRLYSSEHSS